jgi:CRISPR/Cas system-associated exonuclease Cas4 (RecB family)
MGLPKEYISVSQINQYLRCPAQYMYRYERGIILPPKTPLTKGKCVHKGIEVNFSQKMDTFDDLKLSDIQDVVSTEFEVQKAETEWEDNDPGKVKDETISLSTLYHKEVAPTIQPLMIEEKVEVDFDGIKLLGFIDVVDSEGYIRDTKTASKAPSPGEADKSLQLTAYSAAYRALNGFEETGVKLDYLIQNKTPKTVTLEAKRNQKDIDRFTSIMSSVARAIENQIYYPNPTGFMCSDKMCGYWNLCHKEF